MTNNHIQAIRYTPRHLASYSLGTGTAVFFRPSREIGKAYTTTAAGATRLERVTSPGADWECNPPNPMLPWYYTYRHPLGGRGARSWNPNIPGGYIWCRFER